jgi:glycosyltransferase involved in cell wall biosynthesis
MGFSMISVIIPAMNAVATLPSVFRSIFDAAVDGLIGEVILCDGGSTDATREIADAAGAKVIEAGHGQELLAGAKVARKPWLLFLQADAVLERGWEAEVRGFIAKGETRAATFRVRFDGGKAPGFGAILDGIKARALPVRSRCPALLIPAKLFHAWGDAAISTPGYESELVRKLGAERSVRLKTYVMIGRH